VTAKGGANSVADGWMGRKIMKILLVDDDTLPRTLLARTLKKWGHELITCGDGEQAWKAYQDTMPAMIISDWMMPRMDGLQLCHKVREEKDAPYSYFILLTSRSDKESLVEAMAAGVDDFMSKPCDEQELRARMRAGQRILTLSHELARRIDQLGKANACITQINKQLSLDMQNFCKAFDDWARREENESEPQAGGGPLTRNAIKAEVQGVFYNWLRSLKPFDRSSAPEAPAA